MDMAVRIGVNSQAKNVEGVYVLTDSAPYFYQIEKVMVGKSGVAKLIKTITPKSLSGLIRIIANAYGNGYYHAENIDGIPVFNVKDGSNTDVRFSMLCPGVYVEDSSGPILNLPAVNGRVILFFSTQGSMSIYLNTVPDFVYSISGNPITVNTYADNTINFFANVRFLRLRLFDDRTGSGMTVKYIIIKNGSALRFAKKTAQNVFKMDDGTGDEQITGQSVRFYNLEAGTYTAHIEPVDSGYHDLSDWSGTLADSTKTVSLHFVPTGVEFHRFNEDVPIDGGIYQILDSEGNIVKLTQSPQGTYTAGGSASTFTTLNGVANIFRLDELGEYTIVELTSPSGYQTGEDQTFTVSVTATPSNMQEVSMPAIPS